MSHSMTWLRLFVAKNVEDWPAGVITSVLWALLTAAAIAPASAQVPLSAVNSETTVRAISFRHIDGRRFPDNQLLDQLWHDEPGFWDKVRKFLPFIAAPEFPFSPVELQRDVVRLRRFYWRNGYLHPSIDYPASQLDTTANKIHVIFTISKGPPLIIQDVGFLTSDSTYAAQTFAGSLRDAWIDFRDAVTLEVGTRYTDFEGTRLQSEVLSWLQNAGFAFANVERRADIDSTANTVDLRFNVDPGPRGYVSEIEIEGNDSVHDRVVLRELPFSVGDRFSQSDLSQGQRELFSLNLFRLAVAEVPEQPRDSTVLVRYRLREADPRNVRAQTGYSLDQGAVLEGEWVHRNFLGGARQLTVSGVYSSGYGAAPTGGFGVSSRKSATVSLNQPYIFTRKLSGVFAPYYVREQIGNPPIRYQEAGNQTTLIYTIYNYRTVSLRHTYAKAQPLGQTLPYQVEGQQFQDPQQLSIYNRNVFSLSANLGNVDDFINPTSGFMVRPAAEVGGIVVPLKDDVDYFKTSVEAVGYLPVMEGYNLSGRVFLGNIWPRGESRNQLDPQIEYRFDRIRFYAGGSSDVRGWPINLLGPKGIVIDTLRFEDRDPVLDYRYEAVGGLAKIAANVELGMPFPMLGSAWRSAVFMDMGQVLPLELDRSDVRLRDFQPGNMRFGVGGGIRYQTLVGFVRLDLGFKVNPTLEDLADPADVHGCGTDRACRDEIPRRFLNRFRLHLSIGQTF